MSKNRIAIKIIMLSFLVLGYFLLMDYPGVFWGVFALQFAENLSKIK